MKSVNVRLHEHELQKLVRVALSERRRPAEQAAVLIAEGLEQRAAPSEGFPAPGPQPVTPGPGSGVTGADYAGGPR